MYIYSTLHRKIGNYIGHVITVFISLITISNQYTNCMSSEKSILNCYYSAYFNYYCSSFVSSFN